MSPRRYLADTAAAAAAIREFSAALGRVGATARPARLREARPLLADARDRARIAGERLAAQRLEDARLEAQREEVAPLLEEAVERMDALVRAADEGDGRAAARAVRAFRESVERLRSALPAP